MTATTNALIGHAAQTLHGFIPPPTQRPPLRFQNTDTPGPLPPCSGPLPPMLLDLSRAALHGPSGQTFPATLNTKTPGSLQPRPRLPRPETAPPNGSPAPSPHERLRRARPYRTPLSSRNMETPGPLHGPPARPLPPSPDGSAGHGPSGHPLVLRIRIPLDRSTRPLDRSTRPLDRSTRPPLHETAPRDRSTAPPLHDRSTAPRDRSPPSLDRPTIDCSTIPPGPLHHPSAAGPLCRARP